MSCRPSCAPPAGAIRPRWSIPPSSPRAPPSIIARSGPTTWPACAGAPASGHSSPTSCRRTFSTSGFIAQRAAVHARFVHVRRDPIDVGLSNLRTLFTTACPYSYDQQEFVEYYRRYERLMDHWRSLVPDRILDVRYEDVVADPLAAAQRLTDFCGLPFEPTMIEIERSSDSVATGSSVLVRDGIRRDRLAPVARLRRAEMQPMVEALASQVETRRTCGATLCRHSPGAEARRSGSPPPRRTRRCSQAYIGVRERTVRRLRGAPEASCCPPRNPIRQLTAGRLHGHRRPPAGRR